MTILEIVVEQLQQMLADFVSFLPRLAAALMLLVVFLMLNRWVQRAARRATERAQTPAQIERLLINGLRALMLAIGVLIVLGALGVNVAGLAAGLGLTGIVLGFALQAILQNLVAGILLLIERPFNLGDYIEVGGQAGTVTDVVLRATTLRTVEGTQVIIPNTAVYTGIITNYSTYPVRRREVTIQLGYGEDLPRAIAAILGAAQGVPGVAQEPSPTAWLSALGGDSITLTVYFWVDTAARELLATHSDALAAIQMAANRVGLDIAPASTHTVFLQKEQ